MKYTLTLIFLVMIACSSIKPQRENKHSKQLFTYKVYKIDSINSYYLIYAKKGDSLYKIVSKKEGVPGGRQLIVNHLYEFKLYSILSNMQIGNIKVSRQNALSINCITYSTNTIICLEGDSIRDLYNAQNVKGLYFINKKD